jgi:hypothetical protein
MKKSGGIKGLSHWGVAMCRIRCDFQRVTNIRLANEKLKFHVSPNVKGKPRENRLLGPILA